MYLCGLDFETTWNNPVDPTKSRVLEIGAVIWDTKKQAPAYMMSEFIMDSSYDRSLITPELEELCGINIEMLEKFAYAPARGFEKLNWIIGQCEHIVAHYGKGFDKIVYEHEAMRNNFQPVMKNWIDTKEDIDFPKKITKLVPGKKLELILPLHGFINPFPHRALTDVLSMMTMLAQYNIDEVIANSQVPSITLRAHVSMQERHLAKERGFQWNPEKKWWTKQIKGNKLSAEQLNCPFNLTEIVL